MNANPVTRRPRTIDRSRRYVTNYPLVWEPNPMSKGTKTALMIGGGVTALGVAAYFLFFRSSASAASSTTKPSGTPPGGTQTGGTYQGGAQQPQCPPGQHLINGRCVTLITIRPCPPGDTFSASQFYRTGNGCVPPSGQQQGNQPPAVQPVPSPVVVQDGNALSYQAVASGSMLLVQLPQWCKPTNVSWSGSGSLQNLGPTTSAGTETVQLIMPGGGGTLTVNWQDLSNNNAPGSASITLT